MINWGALQQGGGFQNALATGLQLGQMARQRQDEREYRNALSIVLMPQQSGQGAPQVPAMGGGSGIVATPEQEAETARMEAMFPNAPKYGPENERANAMRVIAQRNPQLFVQMQKQEQERQRAAALADVSKRALAGDNDALGQLFTLDNDLWKRLDDRQRQGVKDATTFMAQRGLEIGRLPEDQRSQAWAASVRQAEAAGIDIPTYMEAYTPDVLSAALARAEMTEKYIQQFEPDFRVIPQGGYLEDVNPLTRAPQQQGQAAPQAGAQGSANIPTLSPDQWQANVQSLGLPRAIRWAASNGIAVPIKGDEDFALLPSGATFVGPDGLVRRKP